MTERQVDCAARAMWDAEPVIYSWGPQERRTLNWDEAVRKNVAGVRVFRESAKIAVAAIAACQE